MPNATVRAAAEGLPTLNRRNLIAGAGVSLVSPAFASNDVAQHPWVRARQLSDELADVMSEVEGGRWRAEVWPGSRGEYPVAFFVIDGPSPLAGLVADYRWKEAEDEQLYAEYCELLTATVLPRVAVKIGHRRVVDPETGAPSWDQWTAETPEDIDRYLKAGISVEVDQERAAAITNLQDLQVAHDRAWESSGLAAAERATEAAYDAKYRARQEVFAYRPATLAEVSSKNEFLAELLGSGFQFSPEDLGAVFGQK